MEIILLILVVFFAGLTIYAFATRKKINLEIQQQITQLTAENEKLKTNEPTIRDIFIDSYIDAKYYNNCGEINLEYNAEAARRMIRYPITPLNYSQHLKLKYNYHTDISNDLIDLLFNGNVDNVIIKEKQVNRDLLNLRNYFSMDWDNYFKFGGFPSVMHDTNHRNAFKKLYYSKWLG